MKSYLKLLLCMGLFGISAQVFAQNPIVTHRYLADPGAFVHDGRVYIYASNDDDNLDEGGDYQMTSLVAISSSDLVNWTDHGVVFEVPENASWANYSWAPSPIERDGQFYLYYGNSAGSIGVAQADNPTGPFNDPIGEPLITGSTPGVQPADNIWIFDPMTFIDDDGQAYMYFGGNGEDNMRIIKLNDDMISIDGAATGFTVPYFFEAAWMHKRDDIYYFSYSTNSGNGLRIDYMTSDNPTTGFEYGGVLAPQPPNNNNNNHHSNFELNGQWYQAYHNRLVAQQEGIDPSYKRNLNLDAFNYNEDGSIITMDHTSAGVDQVGNLNPFEWVEAETINMQEGIETQKDETGNLFVTDIEDGDWIRVRGVDFGATGATTFTANVAADLKNGASTGGSIEIRLGAEDGTLVGTVPVSYTGGPEAWQEETIAIDEVTGVQDVYFVFKGGEATSLFNFDSWQFFENTGSADLVALNTSISSSKLDTLDGQNTTEISVASVYADGTSEDITSETTFTFDQEGVVSISEGVITALEYGEVTIYSNYNSTTDSAKIAVKNIDGEITVSRIYSDITEVDLLVDASVEFSVTAEFADGHEEDITTRATFSNPDPNVASIADGMIIGQGPGEVEITVSFQGELGEEQTTTIQITVEQGYGILLEPECGTVGANWLIRNNSGASNGKYVTVQPGTESVENAPASSDGLIEISFELANNGDYSVFGRINGPSANDDSFWLQIDTGNFSMLNGLTTDGWEWIKLGDYTLRSGNHTMNIGYREDGAELDKIAVLSYDAAPQGLGDEAVNICTPTSNEEPTGLPKESSLEQNYPNPFNPTTQINYAISQPGLVQLDIVNSIGQKVATLVNERKSAGNYVVQFNASNLSSGVYFYTIKAGSFQQSKKMLLIK